MKKFFLGISLIIISCLLIFGGKFFWDIKYFGPDNDKKLEADKVLAGWGKTKEENRITLAEVDLESLPSQMVEIKGVLSEKYRLFKIAPDLPPLLLIYSVEDNQWYGPYYNFRYGLFSFKSSDYGYKF